jgi:catalase
MLKRNEQDGIPEGDFLQPAKIIKNVILITSIMTNIAISATAQTPETVSTPQQMVNALHAAFGKHPNARAVHAKGIILIGSFTPAASAKDLSKAPHLQNETVPVTFRFSDFTGIPDISDVNGESMPRGLSIKFHLPDGTSTDIVAHSFNGFPVATTDEFREFLLALSKSGPDASEPTAIEQFLNTHPVAKSFVSTQKPPSVSYATLSYFGVNAFKFTNAQGKSQFIRYEVLPVAGEQFLDKKQLEKAGPDYLSAEIRQRIVKGPIKFILYAQIAGAGDDIKNPSIAWPANRKTTMLGELDIFSLTENTVEEDKILTFNPGNLPDGIEIADQMVADRAKAYPISVSERQ